jgi:phage tail-like protein
MAATSQREDPLTAFRFVVECDSIALGYFTECSGLKAEVEVFEYQEGGLNDYVHKLPGRRKWTNVTLQRGITSSLDMWDWYQDVVAGNTDHRQNMSIILYAADGERIMQWDLEGAYPVNWEGPSMKSDGSTVVVEKLEIAHIGFRVLNP